MGEDGKRVSWVELYLDHAYLWLLAAWMVMCAALSTRASHGDAAGDLDRYLGASRAVGSLGRPSRSRRDP